MEQEQEQEQEEVPRPVTTTATGRNRIAITPHAMARLRAATVANHRPNDDGAAAVGDSGKAVHETVSCDECDAKPIVGVRYKSTTRPNYDICERCLKDNYDNLAIGFVPFPSAMDFDEAKRYEPTGKIAITARSLEDLATQLQHPPREEQDGQEDGQEDEQEQQEQTRNSPSVVVDASIAMYRGRWWTNTTDRSHDAIVEDAIAQSPYLESLHMHLIFPHAMAQEQNAQRPGESAASSLILPLARGILRSRSITNIALNLYGFCELTQAEIQSLCDIVQQRDGNDHNQIKFMFIRVDGNALRYAPKLKEGYDHLATRLFHALAVNQSIHTFGFSGARDTYPLSNEIKELALRALQSSQTLRRVKAQFMEEEYTLDLITMDKKHHWMERWTDGHATKSDLVTLVQEIQKEMIDFDDDWVVPALYHYIRNQPRLCLLNDN